MWLDLANEMWVEVMCHFQSEAVKSRYEFFMFFLIHLIDVKELQDGGMAAQVPGSLLEESHLTQIRLWHEWEINFYISPLRSGVYMLPQQSLAHAD